MRVLAIDHTAELGGAELSMLVMCRQLPAEMRVLLFEDGPLAEKLAAQRTPLTITRVDDRLGAGLRHSRVPLAGLSTVGSTLAQIRRSVLESAEDHRADVLLFNSLRSTALGAMIKWPSRFRRVVAVRDGLCPPYLTPARSAAAQLSLNVLGTHIFANSTWTRRQFFTCRTSSVVPPFIAHELFDAPPQPSLRAESDPVRVLLLGRIARWKGQLLAVEAARLIPERRPWCLTIAGGDWFGESAYAQQVHDEAAALPVPVQFLGHVDDVGSLIDDHDIVLHTSVLPEPFGQVVVQAMARGRTVVAADCGGPAELITSGVNGLTYTMGDAQALAETLATAIHSRPLREQIGKRAREAAAAYHPARTAELFRQLVLGAAR